MRQDILTVMWKEWKEFLTRRGRMRGTVVTLLILITPFGIFFPLQMGRDWVELPVAMGFALWMPLFLVPGVVADSFAGERERHTLETLLASRLSDRAILFGKTGAAVIYGWGLTLAATLLALITVNVASGGGELLLYPPAIGLGIAVSSLLTAWLAAGVGVLVSLRASSVRQAQQSMSIAIMLLLFVPVFGVQALPDEWKAHLAEILTAVNVTTAVLVAAVLVVVLDVGLLAGARARFQRARLILD